MVCIACIMTAQKDENKGSGLKAQALFPNKGMISRTTTYLNHWFWGKRHSVIANAKGYVGLDMEWAKVRETLELQRSAYIITKRTLSRSAEYLRHYGTNCRIFM